MDTFWILLLTFGATFALVQGAYALFVHLRGERRVVNRRLSILRETAGGDAVPQQLRKERWLGQPLSRDHGFLRRLVVQSGLRVRPARWLGVFMGVALGGAFVFSLFQFSALVSLGLGALASGAIVFAVFSLARQRRIARFSAQLPDAIEVMVRSLRAGHTVPRALSLVAGEMQDPAGSEFGIASDELTYGSDLATAMETLYARVGQPDLRFLVVAISVQSATGGSLADVLGNLSSVIRERFKLRRKVRALSAEGRYSALLLSALPFLFFAMLNLVSRDFYADVWSDPNVPKALMVGGFMMLIGNAIMYRMVNYKV